MTVKTEAPQFPDPQDRRAAAIDAGAGLSSYAIRNILPEGQLEIGEVVEVAPTVVRPKPSYRRRLSRPPKYEATDRDMEIAESMLTPPVTEPGYITDNSGPGIELAREIGRQIGSRGAIRRALESSRPARHYPAVVAAHEARHQTLIEKPF